MSKLKKTGWAIIFKNQKGNYDIIGYANQYEIYSTRRAAMAVKERICEGLTKEEIAEYKIIKVEICQKEKKK